MIDTSIPEETVVYTRVFEAFRDLVTELNNPQDWRDATQRSRELALLDAHSDAVKFANHEHGECSHLTHPCEEWCNVWLHHLVEVASDEDGVAR